MPPVTKEIEKAMSRVRNRNNTLVQMVSAANGSFNTEAVLNMGDPANIPAAAKPSPQTANSAPNAFMHNSQVVNSAPGMEYYNQNTAMHNSQMANFTPGMEYYNQSTAMHNAQTVNSAPGVANYTPNTAVHMSQAENYTANAAQSANPAAQATRTAAQAAKPSAQSAKPLETSLPKQTEGLIINEFEILPEKLPPKTSGGKQPPRRNNFGFTIGPIISVSRPKR